jgi:hypothetical protein
MERRGGTPGGAENYAADELFPSDIGMQNYEYYQNGLYVYPDGQIVHRVDENGKDIGENYNETRKDPTMIPPDKN